MTALTQARARNYEAGPHNSAPVDAATRIWEGAAVGLFTATGYARPLTSADTFIGFAARTVDNRSGAAGAVNVDLVAAGSVQLPVTGVVITSNRASVYASDDTTFNLTSGVYIGEVKRYVSAGVAVVAFNALVDLSDVVRAAYPLLDALSTTNSAAAATANFTAIQAALIGAGLVQFKKSGTFYVNDSLILYDHTRLVGPAGGGVIIKQLAGTNKPLLKTNAYANGVGTSVTIAWTAGRTATVTWTAHGKTTNDYVVFTGANQYALNTIARVASVIDANTFTIQLQRTPTATGSGTILGWSCTQNFSIENITFDYDYTNNSSASLGVDRITCFLGRAANFTVKNSRSINGYKFCWHVGAVMDYHIIDCEGSGTQSGSSSEALKTYGPARNGVVDGLTGVTTDDFGSIQAIEDAAFPSYLWTSGDIVNLRYTNYRGANSGGSAILPIYLDDNYMTDDIKIENLWGQTTGATADAGAIFMIKKNPSGTNGIFGDISVNGVHGSCAGSSSYAVSLGAIGAGGNRVSIERVTALAAKQVHGYSAFTAKELIVEKCLRNVSTDTNTSIYLNGPVVKKISIRENEFFQTGASSCYGIEIISGTIDDIEIEKNVINGATNMRGAQLFTLGTVRRISVKDNYQRSAGDTLVLINGMTAGTVIARDNDTDALAVVSVSSASGAVSGTIVAEGNVATANSNGFFRITQTTNANALTLRTANNVITNAAHITVVSGTPTLNVYGWDMRIDPITLTGLAATVGQYCFSTQAGNEGGAAVLGNVNGTPAWYALAGGAAGVNAAIT